MKTTKSTLVCDSVRFFSPKDEDAFFEWIKKIDCIKKFFGIGKLLYLEISNEQISDSNLDELLGLFYRYKINMQQLKQFLTEENKEWFFDNKRAYWHKRVFGANDKKGSEKF